MDASKSKNLINSQTSKSQKLKQSTLNTFVKVTSTINKSNLGSGVFQWNVAGLRAIIKKDNFYKYLKEQDFDIISLNETKIQDQHLGQLGIENALKNYSMYWNCSKPPKCGYAGTAIFSKVKPIKVMYGIGVEKHDQEGRLITLEFDKFYFSVCYVPNSGGQLDRLSYRVEEWDHDFFQYLNDLKKTKPLVLAGDLNVAHNDIDIFQAKGHEFTPGFTQEERESFQKLLDYGFVDTFRELHPKEQKFSYFSYFQNAKQQNKGWRLDYFIIDKQSFKSVVESDIDTEEGSDHTPVKLILDLSKL